MPENEQKRDPKQEAEVLEWIENVLGQKMPTNKP